VVDFGNYSKINLKYINQLRKIPIVSLEKKTALFRFTDWCDDVQIQQRIKKFMNNKFSNFSLIKRPPVATSRPHSHAHVKQSQMIDWKHQCIPVTYMGEKNNLVRLLSAWISSCLVDFSKKFQFWDYILNWLFIKKFLKRGFVYLISLGNNFFYLDYWFNPNLFRTQNKLQ
jgi:hypothetical protein